MCQRTEKLNDLPMDSNNDGGGGGGRSIVLQTNVVAVPSSSPATPPSPKSAATTTTTSPLSTTSTTATTTIEVNDMEINGKHSPASALSPSSITLSPCGDGSSGEQQWPNNGTSTPTTDDPEEYDEVKKFFDKKMHIIERWLRDRATPDIQSKLHDATDTIPKSPKLRTSSVTSDLFQQWLSSSPVQVC